MHPSLWRVALVTLFIALVANILLFEISGDDDWFANVIAIASGVAALVLLVARFVRPSLVGEGLLLSTAVWVANLIEFATEDTANGWNQVRQCGFYGAFAVLSIGAYVATREA
jgi:hypothetical protein